jgi:creatinine amidohydrolase
MHAAPPAHAAIGGARRRRAGRTSRNAAPGPVTMPRSSRSYLLTDLSWLEARDHVSRDPRLLLPVGACDQYGPHLPIGAGTYVAEAVAATLAREFGVLRAPAVPYGVNVPSEYLFAGTASLREKTLHRLLNDLLASWEGHGFSEFIVITAQSYDRHVEAIAGTTIGGARVRVLDVLGLDFSSFLRGRRGPQHGGEVLTSLMLYLCPDKVNLDRAHDFLLPGQPRGAPPRSVRSLPEASGGVIGQPTLATAEMGERIFHHIIQRIRAKVFLEAPASEG